VLGAIVDRQAKADALLEWAAATSTPIENTVAVGDGANDLSMMAVAGLGVGFNCKPIVREHADFILEGHDLSKLTEKLGL
jgi:phosphoserine phosphatase